MWICPNCQNDHGKKPESMRCRFCGINLGTPYTKDKHDYLEEVITLNQYELIIDACAGAGKMVLEQKNRSKSPTKIIPGSSVLIECCKNSNCECVFIECDPKTHALLTKEVQTQPILGDCNDILPTIVDGTRRTLVFMDPNGYGVYPIQKDMMNWLSQVSNTDLLIHFSHRICRQMGFVAAHENSDNTTNRRRALGYKKGLDIYWGSEEIWKELVSRPGKNKSPLYAKTYAMTMSLGNKTKILRIPPLGTPSFYLIFLTKFQVPKRGLEKLLG